MFFIRKPSISFIGANLFLDFLDRIDHLLASGAVTADTTTFAFQLRCHKRLVHPQERDFYFIKILQIAAANGADYPVPSAIGCSRKKL